MNAVMFESILDRTLLQSCEAGKAWLKAGISSGIDSAQARWPGIKAQQGNFSGVDEIGWQVFEPGSFLQQACLQPDFSGSGVALMAQQSPSGLITIFTQLPAGKIPVRTARRRKLPCSKRFIQRLSYLLEIVLSI